MENCNHNHRGEEVEDQPTIIVSCEEARNHESNDDLLGVGRSHECVYCKRGFNTAQALGGHMNIHRKDRAKIDKPSHELQNLINDTKVDDTPGRSSIDDHDHPSQSNERHQLRMVSCVTSFPGSKSPTPLCCNRYQRPINSKRTSLSLEFPSMIVKDLKRNDNQGTKSRDELDLELRLGYDS